MFTMLQIQFDSFKIQKYYFNPKITLQYLQIIISLTF